MGKVTDDWTDTRHKAAPMQVGRAGSYVAEHLPGEALPGEAPVDTLIRVLEASRSEREVQHAWYRSHVPAALDRAGDPALAGAYTHRPHLVVAVRLEHGLSNLGAIGALLPDDQFNFVADRYGMRISDLTGQHRDMRLDTQEWLVRLWDGSWAVYTDERFRALYTPLTASDEASASTGSTV